MFQQRYLWNIYLFVSFDLFFSFFVVFFCLFCFAFSFFFVFCLFFFSIRFFFHRHWGFTGQRGKGGDHLLFHCTTSTRSQTLRHLFATLHVRWLSRIFNRNACVYQTATRWDLPPYRIAIWLIDWWCNVCFFTWWIDSRFLLQRFDIGNRWISTRIDYQPCISSEPTNQVCQSKYAFWQQKQSP